MDRSKRFNAARRWLVLLGAAGFGLLAFAHPSAARAVGPFTMSTSAFLPTSDGGTEPRYAVTPDDKHYVISNSGGTAEVWESNDGVSGWHVVGTPSNQSPLATIDTDIVSIPAGSPHAGRLVAVELDEEGLNFRISYSDNGGVSWTDSNVTSVGPLVPGVNGGELGDQDRPWLAAGPNGRVYLLFHNLASGTFSHHMFVATSSDSGGSFGVPIDTAPPSTQAYTDLQCADSGGPSNLFVNQNDGTVYAVYGTRSSAGGGGCGASITGNFEVNVVAATRIWVATASASGATLPTGWTQSLAVDDNASGKIVGMQLAPAAIDSANNVYVLYPESPGQYPVYDGAAIKYVHASQASILANPYGTGLPAPPPNVWSTPVTVASAGGAGNLLPHIVAGGPGEIDMAWFAGVELAPPSTKADWMMTVGQSLDALDTNPTITTLTLSYPSPTASRPAYHNFTASEMMGACTTNGVENGFLCSRSTDVWGITLDNEGRLQVAWPMTQNSLNQCSVCNDTWVASQTDGPTIAPSLETNVPEAPYLPVLVLVGVGGMVVVARRLRRR